MHGHSLPLFTLSTHTLNNTGGGDDCCIHDPTHPASATASAVQTALLRMLAHASPQNQPYVHVPLPAWLGILPAQPTTAQPGGPMQHTTKRRTTRPPDCVHQATTILTNRTTRTTNSTTALTAATVLHLVRYGLLTLQPSLAVPPRSSACTVTSASHQAHSAPVPYP